MADHARRNQNELIEKEPEGKQSLNPSELKTGLCGEKIRKIPKRRWSGLKTRIADV